MDETKALNLDLLEEVFNEVESEDIEPKKSAPNKKPGFLEDILNFEAEILSNKKLDKKCDKPVIPKAKETELNLIHEGFTDSSDDEDNKYFEESNYNQYGKTLKNLIKQKSKSASSSLFESINTPNTDDSWKNHKLDKEKIKAQLNKFVQQPTNSNNQNFIKDPILNMSIINPLVSSTALKEKLIGRISISTSRLKKYLETPASKDANWVTGGAIVSKMTKTSQKGNQYCLWYITDLSGDLKTVCVFLFGSAYKEHWKLSVGTVVGILNPVVMESKDKSSVTLRVDNSQKILVIGMSKDYGVCKSKKKNGENCSSVVNKSKCDYCVYHMKKEYNIACRRSDLQPPKIGRSIDNLRAKVLGKSQVFYNGKTFTGIVGKKSTKQIEKDEHRLKLLSQTPPISEAKKERDEGLLKRLSSSPKITIPQNPILPSLPQQESKMIDLGFTVTKRERNAAKANALKFIREHGPIKKVLEDVKIKKTPEQINSIKRKLQEEENKSNKKLKQNEETPKNPLQEKYLKSGITEEFLALMKSETKNNHLLKMAENEESEKYFNKLEMKEKIEDKMASTFKVDCKAVRCLKCNYKAFSASELCKKERHPLKVVNAVKRFWKCKNCFSRTVCLELIPLHACKTCGSSKWERASMMPEKKNTSIDKIPLSLRGDEETHLGSVTKQANLNLLVPEDTS